MLFECIHVHLCIYELIYTITISYATQCGFFASLDYNTECQDAADHLLTDMSLSDGVLTLSICSFGIILNVCEIVSLVHAKRTKHTFDIALLSLSFSDLLLAIVTAFHVTVYFSQPTPTESNNWYWTFSVVCIYSTNLSSALHMMFIAVQRLIAVLYPFKASTWITRKRGIITVVVIWLTSTVASVPLSTQCFTYHRMLSGSPFVIAIFIIFCYIIINVKLMTRKVPRATTGHQAQSISVLLYSICITVIFMFCAFPFSIHSVLQSGSAFNKTSPSYVLHLFFLQAVLDPIVYFFSHMLKRTRCSTCSNCCLCGVSDDVPAI